MSEYISILLPTYNRASLLGVCINAVLVQSYPYWELIVCDDASTDDTSRVVQKFVEKDPRIRYYKNHIRQGLPKNRNLAISVSHHDLIFFIEDDLILEQNCLEILVKTFEELKSKVPIGGIAPRLIDNKRKKYFRKENMHKACIIDKKTGIVYNNFGFVSDALQECPTLHACSLIPKRIFEEVGGYEEEMYKGGYQYEEVDFYFRVKKRGYKLYFQSNAITWHKHLDSGGCRTNILAREYYRMRNYVCFVLRFYGLRSVYMVFFYIVIVFFVKFKYVFRNIRMVR